MARCSQDSGREQTEQGCAQSCRGADRPRSHLRERRAGHTNRGRVRHQDMRRLAITRGAQGAAICWWNTKLEELAWSDDFKQLCAGINKSSDLEQIGTWCSLE